MALPAHLSVAPVQLATVLMAGAQEVVLASTSVSELLAVVVAVAAVAVVPQPTCSHTR